MTNLKRDSLVFDSKIVPKTNTYPIRVPMQATGNQYSPFVYAAQVNKSKQIDKKLVTVNTSSFLDLKNSVNVGMNEYAQMSEDSTMKNQDKVWLTARLQIKQVSNAMA